MFAKPFNTSGNTRLKGKDVKKFRVDLLKTCAIADGDKFPWALLAKAEIVKLKLAAPSRTVLYTDAESNVLAFDVNGKGDVVPSMYLLWHEPALREHLPPLIVHSPVSHYLLRGADPMLPGVLKASHSAACPFLKGQLRAVYVNGNPMPFAIGDMLVDGDTATTSGWKGKAMQLLHVVFDELTKMGSPRVIVPDGFTESQIHKVDGSAADEDDELNVDDINLSDELKPAALPVAASTDDDDDDATDDAAQSQSLSVPEMDDLLERCFYQAMRKVKPSDAPMLTNSFYASLVLPSRPVGSSIHVKGTSFKKISTFMKEMAVRGIVELKEQDGVQTITLFRKTHPDVTRHQLHRSEMDVVADLEAEATAGVFVPGKHAPEVVQLYRLTPQTQLVSPGNKASLSLADVRSMLNEYIATHALVNPKEPQFVQLDMHLTDALYHGKNKKPEAGYPDKLHRQEVVQLFLARLKPYHWLQLYPDQEVHAVAGEFRPVHIKTELTKRQKPVTIISNFMANTSTFMLVMTLVKKWACSATLVPAGKDMEVHIQGNLGQDVVTYLAKQYKIASKLCVVEFGKGLKPKK
ncbi:Aste57867_224 [Aphanomyces stellatus]|uniref:Aste57867_224 protein n=1 Tax=Aphanomyces stellatus TaxID=120398 RepID=A0A485K2I3_9STRA|nr:hypothetical protein As57867_000224 [Aphanomyces stellatus]VFT77450.1 Aste57867_224 [Aphanomyces stellatus]